MGVRIIAGRLRGRILQTAAGEGYRPAMGKTREALFSMLGARGFSWQGARVLDVFAGSGSLAFEAISRGAACALLVESAPQAIACLAANVARLGLAGQVHLLRADALRALRQPPPAPYTLVFLDPPYHKNLFAPCLSLLLGKGWLAPGAFVAAEVERGAACPLPLPLLCEVDRAYGQTRIIIGKMP